MAPKVDKLSEEHAEKVKFYKLDVDAKETIDIPRQLGITSMPSFLLFKDGIEVNRCVGANPNGLKVCFVISL